MSDAPNGKRLYETPPGIVLGPLDMIVDGFARNYVLQMRAGRFHGFVVRRGRNIHGYADRCPHAGVPLTQTLDEYLTPDRALIVCQWHGALFEIESGRCVGGPCVGQSLTRWPVGVEDGLIVTR